ncbi:hypothetical protein BJV82DRAFT_288573 [Fennellomyces sp. T-0311]|nr:hypothetical protein BJV82DRAFT_288573 [Fennellomyces sp. T-0311]
MAPAPSLSVTSHEQPVQPEQPVKSQEQHLVKDFDRKIASDNTPSYDPSMWSVVPASSSKPTHNTPSLTWWTDPDDPCDRLAAPDIPVGLRPPGYTFPFAPVVVLSLFHITMFQHRVLSYRPTANTWGSPQYYWTGNGEPVSSSSTQPTDGREQLKPLSDDVKFVAELQKLFGFLEHSERQYGNVGGVVQAVNPRTASANTWSSQDVSADEFIDMVITTLLKADDHRDLGQAEEDFLCSLSVRAWNTYKRQKQRKSSTWRLDSTSRRSASTNAWALLFMKVVGPPMPVMLKASVVVRRRWTLTRRTRSPRSNECRQSWLSRWKTRH